jgi:hypothetical protein
MGTVSLVSAPLRPWPPPVASLALSVALGLSLFDADGVAVGCWSALGGRGVVAVVPTPALVVPWGVAAGRPVVWVGGCSIYGSAGFAI